MTGQSICFLDHVAERLVDLAESAQYGLLRSGQLSVGTTSWSFFA